MKPARIRVSEHALVRYLERVKGVDVKAARRAIETKAAIALDHEGASAVVSDGFRYRIREGKVVTVTHVGHEK